MKKSFLFKIFTFLFVMTLFQTTVNAGLKEADANYEKKLYNEALKEYENLLKTSQGAERQQLLIKAIQCEVFLFKYGEAAQRMAAEKKPQEFNQSRRFLILKTELGREYLKQYGFAGPRDIEDGNKDVTKKSLSEWHQEIEKSFEELWKDSEKLKNFSIKTDADIIDTKDSDLEKVPTFYDFVVERWVDYLVNQADESIINRPKEKAQQILTEATRGSDSDRSTARELWSILKATLQPEKDVDLRIVKFRKLFAQFESARAKSEAGFLLASSLNTKSEYVEALKICEAIQKISTKTKGSKDCQRLMAEIKSPTLNMQTLSNPPPGLQSLKIQVRNLEKVYFRIYKTTADSLRQNEGSFDFNHLRYLSENTLQKILIRSDLPFQDFEFNPKYKAPHVLLNKVIDPVALENGLYIVVASNEKVPKSGSSLIMGAILNITDFYLFLGTGIEGKPDDFIPNSKTVQLTRPIFQVYTLDGKTGEPIPKVDLEYILDNKKQNSVTDENGQRHIEMALQQRYPNYNHSNLDMIAKIGSKYAYDHSGAYFNYSPEDPVHIFTETDRPIYRPGQKVKFKAQVVQRVPLGYKTGTADQTIQMTASDANGEQFYTSKLKTNDFGSVAGEFAIPKGKLLGGYSIQANLNDFEFARVFNGSSQFQVEEYKRPEFEVKVKESDAPWVYGQKAIIQGDVKYYFGGAVSLAKVSYKIFRQNYVPWYMWWLSWRFPNSERKEVISGEIVANEKGEYKIDFTPTVENSESEVSSSYEVQIEARDNGGRTLKTSRSFYAGKTEYNIAIEVARGFYRENQSFEVTARLVDLNNQQKPGSAEFEIFELASLKEKMTSEIENLPIYHEVKNMNQLFESAETVTSVQKGTLKMSATKLAPVTVKGQKEGFYKLVVTTTDSFGNKIKGFAILPIFGNLSKISQMNLPAFTFIENSKVWVGEKIHVVFGGSGFNGPAFLHIGQGQFITELKTIRGTGFREFEMEVTPEYVRGFAVHWFGVSLFKTYSGEVSIDVPAIDRKLQNDLKLNAVMAPGSEQKWTLNVQNPNKMRTNAEASIKVFDRSLEYYVGVSSASLFERLYFNIAASFRGNLSQLELNASSVYIKEGWIAKMMGLFNLFTQEPLPPALKINRTRVGYNNFGFARGRSEGLGGVAMKAIAVPSSAEVSMLEDAAPAAAQKMKSIGLAKEEASVAQDKISSSESRTEVVPVRENMSETAFYEPQIKVSKGLAQIQFKAPDQLTSWKVMGSVISKDGQVGDISGETVTRKDLMVRIEIPRFFRESDQSTIKATIHNETDRPLRGSVELKISLDDKNAAESFGLKKLVQEIEIPSHGLITAGWPIKAPLGVQIFKVQAIVRAGTLSDAEQREFPVLPSRQRLIENTIVSLNGPSEKNLVVPKFKTEDPTRINESMTLQIDPQIALTILNSIPFLVQYPHECTEQILNRYVPLAIMNSMYSQYPQLVAAVKKIPKRNTITPAWEDNDPRRMMTMMESPWLNQSRGISSSFPITDLFNVKLVDFEKENALKELLSRQMPSGGFPWFPGGREDLYITLYVLEGLAQAAQYGIPYPENVVKKALEFAYSEIPKHLKVGENELPFVLYAAYVVTSFPKKMSTSVEGYKQAQVWMNFAEKYSDALTPYGKAQAAVVYHRFQNMAKSESYLARALDGSQKNEISGVFWAPEKNAWLWYNDTVEKHAFFLRALLELKPKDERIPGMVQWLLFNRKGNEWKSTKSSAAAVYSLLDVMKSRGSLDKADQFQMKWASIKDNFTAEPFEWIEKPHRWMKSTNQITSADGEAQIKKTGPGIAFASMTWIYSTDELPKASSSPMMALKRTYFLRVKEGDNYHLKNLKSGQSIQVGDEIEVQLQINTKSQFEYVHLMDPRGSGFEADQLLSGWKWDQISRYEEPRDSLTNFFISWLPHGEYLLKYRVRPTTAGQFKIGAAVLQSMYAPEMSAYSDGIMLNVTEK